MSFLVGVNGEKGQVIIIFVDNIRGDFAIANFFEEGFGCFHLLSLSLVCLKY